MRPNKITGVFENPFKACVDERKNRLWKDTCGMEAKYFVPKGVVCEKEAES